MSPNLNRGEMRSEEISSRNISLTKLGTGLGSSQTRPYSAPVVTAGDMVPEPRRESIQPVLAKPRTGDDVRAVGARDDEGEHNEGEEQDNEYEHADQVDPQKALLFPVGADEAGKGDQQECDSDEDERPSEPADAVVVGLGGEPYAGRDDRNRAHESKEVE